MLPAAIILSAVTLTAPSEILWNNPTDPPVLEQMELFLPDWSPHPNDFLDPEPERTGEMLHLATRAEMYPLVPLPPATQSVLALAACAVTARLYTRFRRRMRSRSDR